MTAPRRPAAPRLLLRAAGRLAPRWLFACGHRWRPRATAGAKAPLLLSFDVDTDGDLSALPVVLDRLRAHGLSASFACVGEWVERRPAEHRRLLAEGHEVLNHGYAIHNGRDASGALVSTRFYHTLTAAEMDRDIRAGHAAIQRTLGMSPAGFRAPHFGTLRRRHLGPLYATLRALGYRYSSSTALGTTGWGVPLVHDGLVELPVMGCPDHPTSPFDSWHLWGAPDHPHAPGDLPRLGHRILADTRTAKGPTWINVYFDPAMAPATRDFEAFLSLVGAADHIEVLTLGAFAACWSGGDPARAMSGAGGVVSP